MKNNNMIVKKNTHNQIYLYLYSLVFKIKKKKNFFNKNIFLKEYLLSNFILYSFFFME